MHRLCVRNSDKVDSASVHLIDCRVSKSATVISFQTTTFISPRLFLGLGCQYDESEQSKTTVEKASSSAIQIAINQYKRSNFVNGHVEIMLEIVIMYFSRPSFRVIIYTFFGHSFLRQPSIVGINQSKTSIQTFLICYTLIHKRSQKNQLCATNQGTWSSKSPLKMNSMPEPEFRG
jgi:hypothetical protein